MQNENKKNGEVLGDNSSVDESRPTKALKRWDKLCGILAKDIDKAIEDSGMSTQECADKIEKSYYFVHALRKGEKLPSLDTVFDIAEATGKTVKISFT